MKQFFLLMAFICFVTAPAQKTVETFPSKKLKTDRELTISLPPSYEKNPTRKYPLLLLLDGDYLFDPFQGALTYGNYWDDLPEVIIVGLSQNKNGERENDCSTDKTTGLPDENGQVLLGYYIYGKFEGKGYMTEALVVFLEWIFLNPDVKLVVADTLEDGYGSQKVLKKNGFVFAGPSDEGLRWQKLR